MSLHQGIDLSRFKKVAYDGKSSTLKHAQGHEIKIAHQGLTQKMREAIIQMPLHMADGGEAQSDAAADDTDDDTQEDAPAAAPAPAVAATPAPAATPEAAPDSAAQDGEEQPHVTQASYTPMTAEKMKAEDVAHEQDFLHGHIKPESYQDIFNKKDTLGKIGTLFGLMLGGAGAGLTHQPNAVLEMMNKQIDRDMEAQRSSVMGEQNYAKLNLEKQMNIANIDRLEKENVLTSAQAKGARAEAEIKNTAIWRMRKNRAALHTLVQQVSKMPMGTPQRQEAEQKLALLYQGVQNENFDIADRAESGSAVANAVYNPEAAGSETGFQRSTKTLRQSGNENLAKDMESKHIPGIKGQASVPITDNDRTNIQGGVQFQEQLNNFINWTKKHSSPLDKLDPKIRNEGQAMAAELQGRFRQITQGGVYKEGEQGFISNIIDSTPTRFFENIRVTPKLEAVQRESAAQLDSLLKSKGFIKGYEGATKEPQNTGGPQEGATGVDKKTNKPVIFKNGKWTYK